MRYIEKQKLACLYINEHKTIQNIADLLGASARLIKKYLQQYNIEIRKRGFGFNVLPKRDFSKDQYDFFDGLMAGDGSICRRRTIKNRKTIGNDFLSCGFKHEEFAEYIINKLKLNKKSKEYIHKSARYKTGECRQFKFLSENNILFTEERNRWYPQGYKILPNDFRFSPISMNILYLGDGFLSKGRRIYIATQSFNKENLKIITNKLDEMHIQNHITKDGQIYIKDAESFLEYIGKCPVKCYEYKWNIQKK